MTYCHTCYSLVILLYINDFKYVALSSYLILSVHLDTAWLQLLVDFTVTLCVCVCVCVRVRACVHECVPACVGECVCVWVISIRNPHKEQKQLF